VLEPYDGKLSRPVLRGVWGGNAPDLPELMLQKDGHRGGNNSIVARRTMSKCDENKNMVTHQKMASR
jgi:hypothetical protein